MEKLAFGNAGITPDAVVADAYGALVQKLSTSYDVKPFAYDWRLSSIDNGARLAAALRDEMGGSAEPVRVLAHGSGGLVALAAFVGNENLAEDFAKRQGSRLVMLGTPLRGSVSVARLLLGHDRLIRCLGLVDLNHTEEQIVGIFRSMPGIIELLPTDAAGEFPSAIWRQINGAKPAHQNGSNLLARAVDTRQKIAALKLDKLPVIHVASTVALTVTMEMRGNSIGFYTRVAGSAASTGEPLADRTWYAPVEPGELARYGPAFEAYADLLATGSTSRLAKRPIDTSSASSEAIALPPDVAQVFRARANSPRPSATCASSPARNRERPSCG